VTKRTFLPYPVVIAASAVATVAVAALEVREALAYLLIGAVVAPIIAIAVAVSELGQARVGPARRALRSLVTSRRRLTRGATRAADIEQLRVALFDAMATEVENRQHGEDRAFELILGVTHDYLRIRRRVEAELFVLEADRARVSSATAHGDLLHLVAASMVAGTTEPWTLKGSWAHRWTVTSIGADHVLAVVAEEPLRGPEKLALEEAAAHLALLRGSGGLGARRPQTS
jgi:hypothetical protein